MWSGTQRVDVEYLWYKGACHDSQTDPMDTSLSILKTTTNKLNNKISSSDSILALFKKHE